MIRTRFKNVLLVAPDVFPEQLLADYTYVKHISSITNIFPSIYQLNPDLILFDYDFMAKDIEKTIRRIKVNKFYNKIKICCYKNTSNEKTDSLLKALGVDQLIYREDLVKSTGSKSVLNTVHSIIDSSVLKWMTGVTN
jgi:hypothetical protein